MKKEKYLVPEVAPLSIIMDATFICVSGSSTDMTTEDRDDADFWE